MIVLHVGLLSRHPLQVLAALNNFQGEMFFGKGLTELLTEALMLFFYWYNIILDRYVKLTAEYV